MAIKTLVNMRPQAVSFLIKDRSDLSKDTQVRVAPRGEIEVDEGLFTPHVKALLRQKHLKFKSIRSRRRG